jgi:adenylate cyclase
VSEQLDHGPGSAARAIPGYSGPSGLSGLSGVPAQDQTPGDTRFTPLLLQLNPFVVLDVVLRSLVPGYRDQVRAIGLRTRRSTPPAAPMFTRTEAAQRAGLTPEDMGRLWRALGFAEPTDDTPGYTSEDIEVVREVAELAAEGIIDIDQVITMVRPMGHLVSRLGAAQVSALSGLSAVGPDHLTTSSRAPAGAGTERLVPMLEGLVVHAWRRHLVTEASAAIPVRRLDIAGAPRPVGFVDITSYTTLSRRIRWAQLALLLDRFEGCVFDIVAECGGQVIKTLGDEVLFVARDPAAAAEIALRIVDSSVADPELPSVHAGLAFGPLLERAGDVFGPTVNVASRVTDIARAGTVLVDGAFHQAIDDDARFRTQRRPRRAVRGYSSLTTYRLHRAEPNGTTLPD